MTEEQKDLYNDALEYLAHVKYDKKYNITRFTLLKNWTPITDTSTIQGSLRTVLSVQADYNWINKYLFIDEVLYCKLYKIE